MQKQIDALRRDPAYADKYHVSHGEVVAQVAALYQRMYGSEGSR